MTISFVVLKVLFYNKYQSILAKLSNQLPEKLNRSSLDKSDTLETIERQIEIIIEERKKEIEHLKKLETYRKEYIGNVSHELKTPNKVTAPAVSAATPSSGVTLVILLPIVFTIFHPPIIVPKPMAA